MPEMSGELFINIEGTATESIFYRLYSWCADITNLQESLQASVDRVLMPAIAAKDDRLLVLVGALVVEAAVDDLLAAIMPGYGSLRDQRDFTFAIKTDVARALRLIPGWILNNVDCIRTIRNRFVHTLSVASFQQLDPDLLASMRDRVSNYRAEPLGQEDAAMFRTLVAFTFTALRGYADHVTELNRYVRHRKLIQHLREFTGQQSAH